MFTNLISTGQGFIGSVSDKVNASLIDFRYSTPMADGIFSTLDKGGQNIKAKWDVFAFFVGAICILGGIFYAGRGVFSSREKSKHFIAGAVAFIVGAILMMTGGVNMIQGNFSDTWSEVFGAIVWLF